jgi:hypothetical protein
MGYFGTYCNNNLSSIKKALEEGLNRIHEDGTVQTMLYHSFKLGRSFMAIEHKKGEERKVFAIVCLWHYAENEVMIKTMDESCGPCYYDAPMKLLKMLTPPMTENCRSWRKSCWSNYKHIPLEYRS